MRKETYAKELAQLRARYQDLEGKYRELTEEYQELRQAHIDEIAHWENQREAIEEEFQTLREYVEMSQHIQEEIVANVNNLTAQLEAIQEEQFEEFQEARDRARQGEASQIEVELRREMWTLMREVTASVSSLTTVIYR